MINIYQKSARQGMPPKAGSNAAALKSRRLYDVGVSDNEEANIRDAACISLSLQRNRNG